MNELEIPKAVKDLDKILDKCRWRMSNHYSVGEWEKFAGEISGSDSHNPLWDAYIVELIDAKLIKTARRNEGAGDGYIITAKGLMFEGFEAQFRRRHKEQTLVDQQAEIDRLNVVVGKQQVEIGKKAIKYGFIGTLLGASIGLVPAGLQLLQDPIVIDEVQLPSIQLVRDTIRLDHHDSTCHNDSAK